MEFPRLFIRAAMLVCTLFISTSHAGSVQSVNASNILTKTINSPSLQPVEIHRGRVSVVDSGDMITIVRADEKAVRIQLAGIDAPEQDQPWGFQAKQQLSKTIFDRQVSVQEVGQDNFGNLIGRVWLGDFNVNQAQVLSGNAWAAKGTLDQALLDAEKQAREKHAGLWGQPEPQIMAPWEWREQASKETPATTHASAPAAGECGSKHSCMEMTSCEEAKHYLKNCGVRALDWDGDGIPCRSLCR